MGYTTEFEGKIKITPKPTKEVTDFVNGLAGSRRVKIDVSKLPAVDNIKKTWGKEGEFFFCPDPWETAPKIFTKKLTVAKLTELAKQHNIEIPEKKLKKDGLPTSFLRKDELIKYLIEQYSWRSIVPSYVTDYNQPPSTQPSLWLQWIIDEDGYLKWDGGEKFYEYVEWLVYLIKEVFKPFNYTLDGEISFQGESRGDRGTIKVKNNEVKQEYALGFRGPFDDDESGDDDDE